MPPTNCGITFDQGIGEALRFNGKYHGGRIPESPEIGGQLPTANYAAAVMPMHAVLPRPDIECNPFDYQSNAHADELYELPMVIQGGTWIWRFVVNTIPVGATLGLIYGSTDYGKIKWTPTTGQSGNNLFDIYAYGQDGQFLRLQWNVSVNTEHCIFASTAGSDTTGDGSRSSPYQTFEYARSQCTGGQLLRIGDGTFYQTAAYSYTTAGCGGLHGGGSALTAVDMSGVGGATNNINYIGNSGFWVGKIKFDNLTTAPENPRFFVTTSAGANRLTQYGCCFDHANVGWKNDDNSSSLFMGRSYTPGNNRSHIAVIGNEYNNYPAGNNGFSCIDVYDTNYLVADNNSTGAKDASGGPRYFLWNKGSEVLNFSIRGNQFTGGWDGKLVEMYLSRVDGYGTSGNAEIAYNNVQSSSESYTTATREDSALNLFGSSAAADVPRPPVWSRRNTYRGMVVSTRRTYDVEFHGDSDVIVNEVDSAWGNKYMVFDTASGNVTDMALETNMVYSASNTELHGNAASGFIDASGGLIGAAATAYKYQRGHEIGGFL